jgi:hypothetical protein
LSIENTWAYDDPLATHNNRIVLISLTRSVREELVQNDQKPRRSAQQ